MATQEQIQRVLSLMKETVPGPLCRRIDESSSGAAAVLGCLYHTGQTQTAGQLSARCHVSTARMAVLLKKMEGRETLTGAALDRMERTLTEDPAPGAKEEQP